VPVPNELLIDLIRLARAADDVCRYLDGKGTVPAISHHNLEKALERVGL
jgi:hypothetical protein